MTEKMLITQTLAEGTKSEEEFLFRNCELSVIKKKDKFRRYYLDWHIGRS